MKSFEYGELNKLLDTRGRPEILEHGRVTNLVKQTIKKTYTDSDISPGPYKGIVLRRDDQGSSISWWQSLKDKFSSDASQGYALKIRVPELDAHLPEPKTFPESPGDDPGDWEIIDFHKTYYPREGNADGQKPEPGDIVWVDYLNGKNVFLSLFSSGKPEATATSTPPATTGPTKPSKKTSSTGPGTPSSGAKNPTESELQKWKERSGHGNPKNIDIVTKEVSGLKVTFSRQTMAKYENFISKISQRTKELELPTPSRVPGEDFRVHVSPEKGGRYLSKRKGSIHNWGNAVDLRIPMKIQKSRPEIRRNYIDLIISTAQQSGFIRFGIGHRVIHMDTGQVGANTKPPAWWVYRTQGGYSPEAAHKKRFSLREMSRAWTESLARPPDLQNLKYKDLNYT